MSGRWLIPNPHRNRSPCAAVSRACSGGRLLGRVHPHVEDPGGDRRAARRPQQAVERREHVAADIGDPQRGVAQALQFRRQLGRPPGVAIAQNAAPDPGPGQSRGSWFEPPGHRTVMLQRTKRRLKLHSCQTRPVAPGVTTVTCSRCAAGERQRPARVPCRICGSGAAAGFRPIRIAETARLLSLFRQSAVPGRPDRSVGRGSSHWQTRGVGADDRFGSTRRWQQCCLRQGR